MRASRRVVAAFIGAALVLFKHQRVGGDPEGAGELAETQEGGLGGAGLVAVDLDQSKGDPARPGRAG
jgi:hypothetical protein